MKEQPCAGSEYQTEQLSLASSVVATGASSGGRSTSTASTTATPTGEDEPAKAASTSPSGQKLLLDGWQCSDANPFRHRVCREIRGQIGDWPVAIVLTVGDADDGGPSRVEVPESAMRWLMTGEREIA